LALGGDEKGPLRQKERLGQSHLGGGEGEEAEAFLKEHSNVQKGGEERVLRGIWGGV